MKKSKFAKLPQPPYYVVLFSSQQGNYTKGYAKMAEHMMELALNEYNCLGVETLKDGQGFGITNSYWKNTEDIQKWKDDKRHRVAQQQGIERWYAHYEMRVARVERAYSKARQS